MKKIIYSLVFVVAITNTGVSQISNFIDKGTQCIYFRSNNYIVTFCDTLQNKYTKSDTVNFSSEIFIKDNNIYFVYSDGSIANYVLDKASYKVVNKDEKSDQYSWFALDENGIKCLYTYLGDKVNKKVRLYFEYPNMIFRLEISFIDTKYKIK